MNNILNFPTSTEYEYTDEDFIRDTQPFWVGVEVDSLAQEGDDLKAKSDSTSSEESPDAYDEYEDEYEYEDEHEDDGPLYDSNLPHIGYDWNKFDAYERMKKLDQMRDSESGFYYEEPNIWSPEDGGSPSYYDPDLDDWVY